MEFSLFFFAADGEPTDVGSAAGGRYQLLLDAARFGDCRGFSAVWTPERHFHRFGGLYPNPSVTGAAIAAVTDRIGIRAGSVVAPLHDALRIAEEWSVVDNLSGGRAGISFGSGWHPTDFSMRPGAFNNRQQLTLETIETVRRLWRREPVLRSTGTGDNLELNVYPAPVQPDLPVWLTSAGSPATFRTAGELGASVLTHLVTTGVPVLARNIAAYREAFRPQGPAIPKPHVTVMLHTFLGGDEAAMELTRLALRTYVLSSMSLFRSRDQSHSVAGSTEPTVERLVEVSVRRYLTSVGLFGSVERAADIVRQLAAIGVDEIACLIDFGLPPDLVLAGLDHLDVLRAVFAVDGAARRAKADKPDREVFRR